MGGVDEPFSETLLLEVCGLFDAMAVWDEGLPGMEWTEMARLGLSLLLKAASSKQLVICSLAAAKLHTLVQVRPMQSKDEICYLMFHMNSLLSASPEDHYAFLLPVMKTLLSQADKLLGGFIYQIPNMPSPQLNSMFHEEFQVFSQTDEWKGFIKEKVWPRSQSYEESIMGRDDHLDDHPDEEKSNEAEVKTKGVSRSTTHLANGNAEKLMLDARVAMHRANRSLVRRQLRHEIKFNETIVGPLEGDVIEADSERLRQS